jgi:hypothetical protein
MLRARRRDLHPATTFHERSDRLRGVAAGDRTKTAIVQLNLAETVHAVCDRPAPRLDLRLARSLLISPSCDLLEQRLVAPIRADLRVLLER